MAPFEVNRINDDTTLVVRGSLDINSAPALAEEIDRIVASRPTKVVVDLSMLDLIDSSGVAALVFASGANLSATTKSTGR